jgi:hypothetical protein
MLELYYALYKEQDISEILYTLISSSIVYGIGRFEEDSFELDKEVFPKKIARLLRTIKLNKKNRIDLNDILELKRYFLDELLKCGFVKKIPILGGVKSYRFLKFIKTNKDTMNENIKLYINKHDVKYLEEIDKRIIEIEFEFAKYDSFGSFYKDNADMYSQYNAIKNGNVNLERYKEYYTISGDKKKIE